MEKFWTAGIRRQAGFKFFPVGRQQVALAIQAF
jgi:hypothetical protein